MQQRTFRRLAIVNRGEPAMRLINAVREVNAERQTEIRTIALYTEPDSRSMFVREADEAVLLGPATYVDSKDGRRKSTYLDYKRLERTLLLSEADAVWVGWGFVAEHADFADLCHRLGIVFIGPSGDVMRQLGDKITSKQIAQEAGVPVAPWSGGPVPDLDAAGLAAKKLGYPLVIKATAGGGGRGIRRVDSDGELALALEGAKSEALAAFGDDTVFMERMLTGARHVEVQIVGDAHGNMWALGVRDCTIQQRNRKLLEEAPSPVLSEQQDQELQSAAVRLGKAAGYVNAGTVEFLYDAKSKTSSFMEVNARLQVEHPVTEMTTGVDLVKLQLHIAAGGRLEGEPPPQRGHAIEVRLNAEDPENGFAPASGVVERFRIPTGPGIRVETGVEEGDEVPADFDSMIAKVIASGRTRTEALARLRRALADGAIVLRGGTCNKGFLLELLQREEVKTNAIDVGWLDSLVVEGRHVPTMHIGVALVQAAIEAYEAELAVEKAQFYASAARGRPDLGQESGRTVELCHQANAYEFRVRKVDPHRYCVDVDGHCIHVRVERTGRNDQRLTISGERYRVLSVVQGVTHIVEVNGIPHRILRDRGGVVRAPAPAVVVSVAVKAGDDVAVGDRLTVLEAMKTETALVAKFPGKVREVLVVNNVQVSPGDPLLVIEPPEDDATAFSGERVHFEPLQGGEVPVQGRRSVCAALEELRCLMLGFDADTAALRKMVAEWGVLCPELPAGDEELLRLEDDILTIFVDISSLFRRQAAEKGEQTEQRFSQKEYLYTYLRDLSGRGAGLPNTFVKRLEQALAHFGVPGLSSGGAMPPGRVAAVGHQAPEAAGPIEPSDRLREVLFRIYKSHKRIDEQTGPILSVLQRRLDHLDVISGHVPEESYRLIDRVIAETQTRFPVLNDVAREVRYRYFDQPVLERAREQVYKDAQTSIEYLVANPGAADRKDRINALVDCPQPVKGFLTARVAADGTELRRVMLEVMTRRYYRIRPLEGFRLVERGEFCFASAEYAYQDKLVNVVSTYARLEALEDATRGLTGLIAEVPRDNDIVLEVYGWRPDGDTVDAEERQRYLAQIFDKAGFSRPIRRIVVSISGPKRDVKGLNVEHYTFRQGDDGFHEEMLYRGLHPMMGKRLHLWRLSNFDIERLPSAEDVYLFRGVGRENAKDERLFALAEVRDLTPVKDETGRVVRLPHLERMLLEALTSIRRVQAQRPVRGRLHWNRVQLFAWPVLDLKPDELTDLVQRLAPPTVGLGLESVVVRARMPDPQSGTTRDTMLDISNPGGRGLKVRFREPPAQPMKPLSEYDQKVVALRRRGLVYPYELVGMLTPPRDGVQTDFPPGEFQEYDLDGAQQLVAVDRPYGMNKANIVVGVIRNFTAKYPEGMSRVVLLGDPSRAMGSLAEPECRRINAALELARKLDVPLEWFAVSAGAKISMDSGVENMDWIALVLRRIIEYTQDGYEINVVVCGVNVGAQPYWNAEATMLMHTRGILIMTAEGSMVLTGKQALDYSGGVSAEDNLGIGGYERIMGPNGQAQYLAADVHEACQILLRYYEHSYVAPGERFPRRAATSDPAERDVRDYPHGRSNGYGFNTVGEVLSEQKNPGRKKPFDIRRVMLAASDQDHMPLERWYGMRDAEVAVVWDACLGGYPVCMLGLESRPLERLGFTPADGPASWTAGTLFPLSSKKVSRAVNSASGNRPLVILANLSGFDGSPESMRNCQLEFGAEIGRSVVNFKGPIVFCVVSRYHGGAFVVFSNKLNEGMEVAALEGTFASVIGGAPAAAVVFAREVKKRTQLDSRLKELEHELAAASGAEKVRLRSRLNDVTKNVYSEKLGQVADEFDKIHSVHRAQQMGAVHEIIPPEQLRPWLIHAVERGIKRELGRSGLKQ